METSCNGFQQRNNGFVNVSTQLTFPYYGSSNNNNNNELLIARQKRENSEKNNVEIKWGKKKLFPSHACISAIPSQKSKSTANTDLPYQFGTLLNSGSNFRVSFSVT